MGEFSVLEEASDRIMEWIKQTRSIACFFMTWTEEDNEAFQEEMSSRYRKLADKYGCKVAPVGEKWWAHIHEHPEIDLYFEDRRHASVEGTRLAAQTIYDTLFTQFLPNL